MKQTNLTRGQSIRANVGAASSYSASSMADNEGGAVGGSEEKGNLSGVTIPEGSAVRLLANGSVELADTAQETGLLGIAADDIEDATTGPVVFRGPVGLVLVGSSVTAGDYGETTTTPGEVGSNATRRTGSFLQFTSSGTEPTAEVWCPPDTGTVGLNAEDVAYDNSGSGLTADDVQEAIDELASSIGGSTGLLAVTEYAPTSQTVISHTSGGGGDGDLVDADANLTVTFTAPASGNVIVVLSAFGDCNATNAEVYWGLREGSSTIKVARVMRVSDAEGFLSVRLRMSGISAGSHTYKWAYGTDTGSRTIRIIVMDGSAISEWAPGLMEVWAAP